MSLPSITIGGVRVQMPYSTKERPRCRAAILSLCREEGITVPQLWERIKTYKLFVSDGLKKQCRKMVAEHYKLR
jgi:hypothetical protein